MGNIELIIRKDFISALIHEKLDAEITCAGNGISPDQAVSVYKDIALKTGVSTETPTKEELKEFETSPYYQELLESFGYNSLIDFFIT